MSATKVTNLPSGEMAACSSVPSQSVSQANVALSRGFGGGAAGRRACSATNAAASTITATHGSHLSQARAGAAGAARTRATPGTTSAIASISIRTSPMSRRRPFGSFVKQRSRSRRIGSGVVAGSADQSGSRSRILAIESGIVSPGNATRPVTISKSTQPNAQMSVRLSTGSPRACSGLM